MDKVLFLLHIPEEIEETETIYKNKESEAIGIEKSKSQELGDNSATCTKDSEVDPEAKATGQQTLSDEGKQKAATDDTKSAVCDSRPLQDDRQRDSCPKQTASNVLPASTPAGGSPRSEKNQTSVPEPSSMVTAEKDLSVSDGNERECPKSGEEKAVSPVDAGLKSIGAADDNLAPLLTQDMIGQELTDDFWDFDGPANADVDKVHETGASQGSPQSERKEDTDAPLPDQAQIAAEKEEKFVTCPSTPESSNKGQNKNSSNDSNVPSSVPDKSQPDVGPSSEKHTGEPNKEAAASDVKALPVSGKFTTTPVEEPVTQRRGSEPAKAIDADTKISDKFLMTPVKGMLKSASTGEMKNTAVNEKVADAEKFKDKTSLPAGELCAESKKNSLSAVDLDTIDVDDSTELIDFMPKLSLRRMVRKCLEEVGVRNVVWQRCTGNRVWQVTFVEDSGVRCENIMLKLAAIGVGRAHNSSISIIPVSIHAEKEADKGASSTLESGEDALSEEKEKQIQEKATEFHKSIKSRLVVRQIVKSVEGNAELTFDYVMFIILASIIAALGLMENSSVVLVASMLISPLMGPILAGTFGTVIKNNALRNLGIRSELIGLGICLICGFVCGLVMAALEASSLHWRNSEEWPTTEMSSRGVLRGLVVGMMIALPSGAGVALSVLGGNIGSLVGVAISASLLPPAVNAGMLWASAVFAAVWTPELLMQKEVRNISEVINGTTVTRQVTDWSTSLRASGLQCPQFRNNDYVHIYICNTGADLAILGTVSLFLTILNIFCIFVMGIVVLKIKEVAPRTSTQLDQNFFKKDIKIARESYTTTKGPQSAMMGKKWLEEYKNLKKQMEQGVTEEEDKEEEEAEDTIEFQQILQNLENSPEVREVLGRVGSLQPISEEMAPEFQRAAVRHLERHPELDPVVHHTLGHSASSTRSSRPSVLSVYHTVRSPWILPTHQPMFVFPSTFNHPPDHAAPATTVFTPTRLAPISKTGEQRQRKPRLYIPKNFQVSEVDKESGTGSTQDEGEVPKKKQGKMPFKLRRSARLKAQKPKSAMGVVAELPLLEVDEEQKNVV
ncbi:uncharacterized protein LOC143280550 [Babylonia areolata]|uniref:uncharacterized protein LOC143280550 n=1 Tax=Babylonia areolata TaxID=304850 RepID=UPI003FD0463D